ncbi:1-acyl-sn-glycerol-3-phosphate acyltransferase [Brucepastera parasyntrophica]|uniref:1-acyl-sn-glycerol-3-phosphate acyltransferase n=1 Tax=Brucepastera parasyntrophica TaxID=2880008 RepID=UPI00210B5DC4|nr:1-acyl-sn-glycerol-3-phosphate acyltransferase [Brucepastera parasyntrophica]ULQ58757.1 1-acyl-sn-glycerol-3-phosphate acyltransferase [Brucepastera parasyntrophica]
MPYKRGRPLIDTSLSFRIASAMTFYVIWPIAQAVNSMMHSTAYENRKKFAGISRAVLVSNHTTFLDPVKVSGIVLPNRMWHTLLEPTAEAPVIGTLTRLLGGMPLPRGKEGLKRFYESCEEAFRYRRFIHFYPEGECYRYNQNVVEFKTGAFLLSAYFDVPVIPLLLSFPKGTSNPFLFWAGPFPGKPLLPLIRFIRPNILPGMKTVKSVWIPSASSLWLYSR